MRWSAVVVLAAALVAASACGGRSRETVITPAPEALPTCDDAVICWVEFCAPTLDDALLASNWPASKLPHATTYSQCADGTSRFEQPGNDGGYSVAYDAGGRVTYAALWPPADRPVCGEAPGTDVACKSCLITARLPPAGGADSSPPAPVDAGTGSVPPCEVDGSGRVVMPS